LGKGRKETSGLGLSLVMKRKNFSEQDLEEGIVEDLKMILSFSSEKIEILGKFQRVKLPAVKKFKILPSFFKNVFICPSLKKTGRGCLSNYGCCRNLKGAALIGIKTKTKIKNRYFLKINQKKIGIPYFSGTCPYFVNNLCHLGGDFEKFHKTIPIICHVDFWNLTKEKGILKISRKKCPQAKKIINYDQKVLNCDLYVLEKISKFYKRIKIENKFLKEIKKNLKNFISTGQGNAKKF